MSEAQIRKERNRRKRVKNLKKTITAVVLAPGKLPRITASIASRVMRYCEIAALVFVAVLLLHMSSPDVVSMIPVVLSGMIFAGLLSVIVLSDYQDKLEEYELYGFRV